MAVHSDNTGDDIYAERITTERANAVDEYFAPSFGGESPIIPYGLGSDEPVAPNSGVANREKTAEWRFISFLRRVLSITPARRNNGNDYANTIISQ